MKCPIDAAELVMSERQGVEIDYCPTCRGVWLDRGELDKILDRAAEAPAAAPAPAEVRAEPLRAPEPYRGAEPYRGSEGYRGSDGYRGSEGYRGSDGYRDERYRGDQRPGYKKKKESWLSDILDFG